MMSFLGLAHPQQASYNPCLLSSSKPMALRLQIQDILRPIETKFALHLREE